MYICRCRMMMNCVDHHIWYIGAYAVSIIMGCKHYNHDVGVNLLIQCELDSLQQSFPCILWHAEAQAVSGPHLDFLFRVPPGDSDFFLFLSSTQQTVLSRMPIQQPQVAELIKCLWTNPKLVFCFRRSFFFSSPSAFSFLILSCMRVHPGWFAEMRPSSSPRTTHISRANVLWTFEQFFRMTMTMHEVSDSVHQESIHKNMFH